MDLQCQIFDHTRTEKHRGVLEQFVYQVQFQYVVLLWDENKKMCIVMGDLPHPDLCKAWTKLSAAR